MKPKRGPVYGATNATVGRIPFHIRDDNGLP
jgi:hypothetical protein